MKYPLSSALLLSGCWEPVACKTPCCEKVCMDFATPDDMAAEVEDLASTDGSE